MENKIDCIIEIKKGTSVKYEFDKKAKRLRCDRVLGTSMVYPFNYGYIENTLSGDGDPLDVMVVCDFGLEPMSIVSIKVLGVIRTLDGGGEDDKIIAVPSKKVNGKRDVSNKELKKIMHFFNHYKEGSKVLKCSFGVDNAMAVYKASKRLYDTLP